MCISYQDHHFWGCEVLVSGHCARPVAGLSLFQVTIFCDPITRSTSSHPPCCAAAPHCHHRALLEPQQSQMTALTGCLCPHTLRHGSAQVNGQSGHCCAANQAALSSQPSEKMEKPKGSEGHLKRGTENNGELCWEGKRPRSGIIDE